MPVYQLTNQICFPKPEMARGDGLLAVGGDLDPQRLLLAYVNGIFPWYNEGEPILWWSPNPRAVLYPNDFKVSKSLKQNIRKYDYKFRLNYAFKNVLEGCSSVPRNGQNGTWLNDEMKEAYLNLYDMGYAWSVETYQCEKLVGGLYGVQVGAVFSGESMFHLNTDASKAALYFLCLHADSLGVQIVDVQQSTSHLRSLGAIEIERTDFLSKLAVLHKK